MILYCVLFCIFSILSDVRRYICLEPTCGKAFKYKTHLLRHGKDRGHEFPGSEMHDMKSKDDYI